MQRYLNSFVLGSVDIPEYQSEVHKSSLELLHYIGAVSAEKAVVNIRIISFQMMCGIGNKLDSISLTCTNIHSSRNAVIILSDFLLRLYYDTYEWVGSLLMLEPGQGYKIKNVTDNTRVFRYPGTVVSLAPSRSPFRAASQESHTFQAVDYHNYSGNVTLAAKVYRNAKPLANVEVGAFADCECRASAFTGQDGVVYLTIPGDDAVELNFKVAEGASVTDVRDKLDYVTDAIYGTPQHPLTFDLDGSTGIGRVIENTDNKPAYDVQGREVPVNSANGVIIINNEKLLSR